MIDEAELHSCHVLCQTNYPAQQRSIEGQAAWLEGAVASSSAAVHSKLTAQHAQAATKGKSARLLREFYDTLVKTYGPQGWWPANTPLEVVLGAYLTQNTSWKSVERSIRNLEHAGVLDLAALRDVSEEDLRTLIRPSGYMVRKAAAIKAFVALLDREFGGSLPKMAETSTSALREKLLQLPGVGPETADAILLYALGHAVIVVDEYLRRIVARHGLASLKPRYDEIQQLALAAFARDSEHTRTQHYNEFHALVVEVGKRHCGPRPSCGGCPLNEPRLRPPNLVNVSKPATNPLVRTRRATRNLS
jgi:endonuclease-3 related protein